MATVTSLTETRIMELIAEFGSGGSDLYDGVIGDLTADLLENQAMLDELNNVILPALQSDLAVNAVRLDELNDTILPNLNTDLATNADMITELNTVALPNLQSDLAGNTDAIATLNVDLGAMQEALDGIDLSALSALQSDLDTLNNTTLPALQSDISTAQGDLAILTDTTLPALQTDLTSITNIVIDADLSGMQLQLDEIPNIQSTLATLNGTTLPALQSGLSTAQGQVNTLTGTTIPGLNTDLASATSRITTAEGSISTAQAQISTLNTTTIPGLNASITTAQGQINTLNNTTIPGINTQLTQAQTDLQNIGGGNLLANSSFEADGNVDTGGGWSTGYGGRVLGTYNSTHFYHGTRSLQINPASNGDGTLAVFPQRAVKVGDVLTYSFHIKVLSGGDTNQTISMFQATASYITTSPAAVATQSTVKRRDVGGGWTRIWQTYTVTQDGNFRPSLSNGVDPNGTTVCLDAAQIEIGSVPTAYAPKPDEILPGTVGTTELAVGSVTTAKMTANTIDGSVITANTLNASKIVAGSITTDRMTANSITGDRIQANTLDAAKIVVGSITTDRMTANSISGDRITANTLNADKIVAGSITADQVAANAITASKLTITSLDNLVLDPYFQTGSGSSSPSWTLGNGATLVAGIASDGRQGARLPRGGYVLSYPENAIALNPDESQTYRLRVKYRSTTAAVPTNSVVLALRVYRISDGGVEYIYAYSTQTPAVNVWTTETFNVTVPTGRKWGSWFFQASGNVVVGNSIDLEFVGAARAADANLIVDGAITTVKMTANTINGDRISANTLNADKIVAGSITTTQMTANSINGDRITANTLNADRIIADTITASKLQAGSITADKLTISSVGDQMILNGNFQDVGSDGVPVGWGMNGSGTIGQTWTGSVSWLRVTLTNTLTAVYQNAQNGMLRVKPGEQYYVEAAVAVTQGVKTWAPAMYFYDRDNTFLGSAGPPAYSNSDQNGHGAVGGGLITVPSTWGTSLYYARVALTIPPTGAGTWDYWFRDVTVNRVQNSVRIQDGAITAAKIVAGSVSTEKLTVGSLAGDLVVNGRAIDPSASGALPAGWTQNNLGTADCYREVNSGAPGGYRLVAHSSAGVGNYARVMSTPFPVVAGRVYTLSAMMAAAYTANAYLGIGWHTADPGPTSNLEQNAGRSDIIGNKTDLSGSWGNPAAYDRISGQVTAPANALFGRVVMYNYQPSTESYVMATEISVREPSAATQIADGAIITQKMTANSISGDRITANTLNADKIVAGSITTTQMTANSINGDRITANTLGADKIVANSITASQIAAGAITTEKLTVASMGSNLVPNGGFEDGLSSWLSRDTDLTPYGNNGGTVAITTDSSSGRQAVTIVAGSSTQAVSTAARIPCTPGELIYISAMLKQTGSASSYFRVLYYPDLTSSYSSVTDFFQAAGVPTTYTKYEYTWTPPAGAKYFRIAFYNVNTTGTLYIDDVQAQVPVVSGMIADGAIITQKMTANTINGDRVTANTLQAAKIVAGSISTNEMTANTINGDRITTNTLQAGKIVAGSISTNEMTANTISGDRITGNTLDAGKIVAGSISTNQMTANTINGDRILTNTLNADRIVSLSITTGKLATTAIDTMTITLASGGQIRTSASNPRVVFDSTGLWSTDASGNRTLDLAASNGSISIMGTLRTAAATVVPRIEIGTSASNTIYFYTVTNTTPGTAGLIYSNSNNLTISSPIASGVGSPPTIVMQGTSVGGRTITLTAQDGITLSSATQIALSGPLITNGNNIGMGNGNLNGIGDINQVVNAGALTFATLNSTNGGSFSATGANFVRSTAAGRIYASATTPSSRLLKTKIKDMDLDIEDLLKIRPRQFAYKDAPDFIRVGVIAEEVADIGGLDLLVGREDREDPDRPTGFNYDGLAVALLAVLQNQEKRIAQLEAMINK